MSPRMKTAKRLRVGILCGPIHSRLGGPAAVVSAHIRSLSSQAEVTLFGVVEPADRPEVLAQYPDALLFDRTYPTAWYRGQGLRAALAIKALQLDVLHAHMLWDHPVYAAWRISKQFGIPLVITPHGTLAEPWRWSSPHKRLYRRLIADRMLEDASAVHVLSAIEADAIKKLGLKTNTVIIPNGLLTSRFSVKNDRAEADVAFPRLAGRRIVLFLGRLWSEKGLDILPRAWAAATNGDDASLLVIAGPDYKEYKKSLMRSLRDAGVVENTLVTGPVFGSLKESLFAAANVFVLPSRSEGFSMALLEATASSVPAIFTQACNFTELATIGGGWEIERNEAALASALKHALSLPESYLSAMGNRAHEWSSNRFTLEKVGADIASLYGRLVQSKADSGTS